MAGSIEGNAALYKKKNFTYVPPSPPAELIETTSYTINFTARKFILVGIDPTDNFQVTAYLLTPSRHVKISPDFLRRIFSMMGHIFSFILDTVQYKRIIFLETELHKISSMVYGGENVLVIESKTQDGCRVLLNRADLIQLQYLEWCIYESVSQKSNVTKPAVLKQFDMFLNYIDQEFTKVESPPRTNEEMITFIKNVRDESVIAKNDINFVGQLKMFAASQLAEQWAQRRNGEMSPELFTESEMKLIPPLSPPRYSSMSPMLSHDEEDLSQSRGADEERGLREYLNFNVLPQVNPTWAPTKSKPTSPPSFDCLDNCGQYPPWHDKYIEPLPTSPAVDENDGPSYFNKSPSILDFTGGKPMKKRNAKRKLFLNDIV